jgi:hypothetical protein
MFLDKKNIKEYNSQKLGEEQVSIPGRQGSSVLRDFPMFGLKAK